MTLRFYNGAKSKTVNLPGQTHDEAAKSEEYKHLVGSGWSLTRKRTYESKAKTVIESCKTPAEAVAKLVN